MNKKLLKTCICHLVSNATNYLVWNALIWFNSYQEIVQDKQINNCSLIIKLYKSQHYWSKRNSANTKEFDLPFKYLIKTITQYQHPKIENIIKNI